MSLPILHTDPTIFIFAVPTSHMIAASILFSGQQTLWTILCIGRNPIVGFALIFALFLPHSHLIAGDWKMGLETALKAKDVTTKTGNDLSRDHITCDDAAAAWSRTPLEMVAIFNKRVHQKLFELVVCCIIDESLHCPLWNEGNALKVWTVDVYCLSLVDLVGEVAFPA